jgi:hypothetical protein
VDVQALLDLAAHVLGPRLGAEDPDAQRGVARVDALALQLVDDGQQVARRHHDDVRLEVADQHDLPLGHATGDRDDGAAQLLGAVVRAEAAGEQPVPVRDVDLVAGAAAGGADRAGHEPGPGTDVLAGVPDHGRPAGGTRGRVQADDLLRRYGEHPERVVLPQVRLVGEREAGQVGELPAVVRVYPGRVERLAVMRHVVVRVPKRPAQPLQLQRTQLVDRRPLDGLQLFRPRTDIRHGPSSSRA